MDRLSVRDNTTNSAMAIETSSLSGSALRRFDFPLLTETVLTMTIAIGAIKILGESSALVPAWLMTPCILIFGALVPTAIKRDEFSKLGFNLDHLKESFVVLGWTCIAVLPLAFCGLWLLKSFGFNLLARGVFPQGLEWIYWLLYQFMYIALAEEVFFRGYVQSNILRLTTPIMDKWPWWGQLTSIGISAVCFAIAHIIVQGHVMSALTFLPGLILGWLFIRTKSLLVPILFHGAANAFYVAMSVIFA